jgi:hypothetical protein
MYWRLVAIVLFHIWSLLVLLPAAVEEEGKGGDRNYTGKGAYGYACCCAGGKTGFGAGARGCWR